jgi:D-alanyl-D-alanine carboxypeptidase-like protein
MSAGMTGALTAVRRDLNLLAPLFREAVERALRDCRARGLDAYVYETYRTNELQALYYARGRTVIPPLRRVTNAASNLYSWHGYGLAVDVISKAYGWNRPESWFADVARSFKDQGCRWGGEWTAKDLPHFQWGRCKPSPSDLARQLLRDGGAEAVWSAVRAVDRRSG